jgi:phosphopantothenoylcysteine decarboxylase/phosphopantothenate--cysteine ligase
VLHHVEHASIVIKAAAVADYRMAHPAEQKIKGKRDLTLELTPNPDILAEVAARAGVAFIVGFAAETHDVVANARAKLQAKGIDLLVANDVSRRDIGFDAEDNEVLLIDRWGGGRALPRMPKGAVADAILDEILALRVAHPAHKVVR